MFFYGYWAAQNKDSMQEESPAPASPPLRLPTRAAPTAPPHPQSPPAYQEVPPTPGFSIPQYEPPPPYSPALVPGPCSPPYPGSQHEKQHGPIPQPYQPADRSRFPIGNTGADTGFEDMQQSHRPAGLYPTLEFGDVASTSTSPHDPLLTLGKTPIPPNSTLLWESSIPVRLFFVQSDGQTLSLARFVQLCVYKCPPMNDVSSFPLGSLAGRAADASILLKAEETWRLGLSRERSYVVRGLHDELIFLDVSTTPQRVVVVLLPKEMEAEKRQLLVVLVKASSNMLDEPTSIVDQLDSGAETVFDYLSESVSSAVKKGKLDLHKNTKWLRKGTGQVVRKGGALVSKGIHLLSENIAEKDAPTVHSDEHSKIMVGLKQYREAVNNNTATEVPVID